MASDSNYELVSINDDVHLIRLPHRRRSWAYPIPGNWESIIGYRQSIGSLTDDDLSVAPSDLDLRSAPPSEVDVAELPRFEPETDNLGEADDEVEEFEEDDE
ncbi:hypothetical protein PIIN_10814 [Serendipita indica DSM 11827]|uniref:Uncharacterized protein n=1 Tax=Serendipita indica (strain DSM 11827) TaxID=1109443 RepID=G4TZT5_SERID|nr:hypothetical protein PIIN_10814 [Serendipita indica DSM 11827]